MGRVLAGTVSLGSRRPGRVLGTSPSSELARHGLALGVQGNRPVPPDGPRERMAHAPRVVRPHGGARPPRRRGLHAEVHAVLLPRQARRAQGRDVRVSARPLGRALRVGLPRDPLRPDEHVLRGRRDQGGEVGPPAPRLQPRQAGRLPPGRDRARAYARRAPAAS